MNEWLATTCSLITHLTQPPWTHRLEKTETYREKKSLNDVAVKCFSTQTECTVSHWMDLGVLPYIT